MRGLDAGRLHLAGGIGPGRFSAGPGVGLDRNAAEQIRRRLVEVPQLRQRRQRLQALQIEGVEEVPRRPEDRRPSRRFAMTDDAHPFALDQRLHDGARYAHAADLLDFAAADGLAVGDKRERLQQRPGVARRALLPQHRERLRVFPSDLGPKPACDLRHLQRTVAPALRDLGHRLPDRAPVWRIVPALEHRQQLVDRHRSSGREQRRLDVQNQLVPAHRLTASPRSASPRSALTWTGPKGFGLHDIDERLPKQLEQGEQGDHHALAALAAG